VAALTVGFPWSGKPLLRCFPKAFEHEWVYAALIVASTTAFSIPNFAILPIAARPERSLTTLTSTTSLVYIGLVALLARPLGRLGLPVVSVGNRAIQLLRFRPLCRSVFGDSSPEYAIVVGPLLAADV